MILPIVTIIMATYNREKFIVESLKSIQAQTYTNWECLIIDDGCADNTESKITPILNTDSRFKFLKRPSSYKKGLPGCRNYGLKKAKGNYVIFFDDDDIIHPDNLEICLSIFRKKDDISFCNYIKQPFTKTFNYDVVDRNKDFNYQDTDDYLLENVITQKIPFASCTVMWKKNCFNDNNFNENLLYAEEWECYQRILITNIKGVIISKILYYNRKHNQSNTGEFWSNNPKRVNSKKEAIKLVFANLYKNELLTPYLYKYLLNLSISFRDFKLINSIFKITRPSFRIKAFYTLKFYLFPVWVFYKKRIKN